MTDRILSVLTERSPALTPVPEIVARTGVDDATVRFELRVLRGQLRVTEEGGGWRVLGYVPQHSAATLAGLRAGFERKARAVEALAPGRA